MRILPVSEQRGWEEKLEIARLQDNQVFQAASVKYTDDLQQWEKRVSLAKKVRGGEPAAYAEAINELSPLAEIQHFGSSTEFIVHNPRLLECTLALSSDKAIPAETKTLTASNKVSVKSLHLRQQGTPGRPLRRARKPVKRSLELTVAVEKIGLVVDVLSHEQMLEVPQRRVTRQIPGGHFLTAAATEGLQSGIAAKRRKKIRYRFSAGCASLRPTKILRRRRRNEAILAHFAQPQPKFPSKPLNRR